MFRITLTSRKYVTKLYACLTGLSLFMFQSRSALFRSYSMDRLLFALLLLLTRKNFNIIIKYSLYVHLLMPHKKFIYILLEQTYAIHDGPSDTCEHFVCTRVSHASSSDRCEVIDLIDTGPRLLKPTCK